MIVINKASDSMLPSSRTHESVNNSTSSSETDIVYSKNETAIFIDRHVKNDFAEEAIVYQRGGAQADRLTIYRQMLYH